MDRDKLFAYHKWATLGCLEHMQTFDEEIYRREGTNSFDSIEETMAHVIGVEKMWFLRMNGIEKPSFERFDVSTAAQAKEAFLLLHAEMELFFSTLSEEQWQETLAFTTLRDDHFQNTREEMLFTFVNHATYHRGQVTSFLRQFGKTGIPLDYIYFK